MNFSPDSPWAFIHRIARREQGVGAEVSYDALDEMACKETTGRNWRPPAAMRAASLQRNAMDNRNQNLEAPFSRKGAQTRTDLLEATLRIIVRDGHQQVTLRSVAQEARQSHGSVAYHFGSRAALMTAAMEHSSKYLYNRSKIVCGKLCKVGGDIGKFAELMTEFYVESLIEDVTMGVTVLELNIAAAREDYLRPILYKWGKRLQRLYDRPFRDIGSKNSAGDFQFFLQAVNGFLIAQRALPRKDFEERMLRPSILRVLKVIASGCE
jgi:AcrR family transcriptional regulator